jgi:CO/xanthine dehydrogenase FAD-binding subunit
MTRVGKMNSDLTKKLWSLDADSPLQSVLEAPECSPLLRRTLTGAISWQTRNETPLRKALASPRIAPQWVAALLALGATVTVERGEETEDVSLEALLYQGEQGRATTLHVPLGGSGRRWGEARVARTPADEPIVAVVAVVDVEADNLTVRQARIALTGVWPKSVRLAEATSCLVGRSLDETSMQAVVEGVEKEIVPKGDFLGSEAYRRAMASVLTHRALEQCLRQEGSSE